MRMAGLSIISGNFTFQLINHSIIVWGIIASDAQDLLQISVTDGMSQSLLERTFSDNPNSPSICAKTAASSVPVWDYHAINYGKM